MTGRRARQGERIPLVRVHLLQHSRAQHAIRIRELMTGKSRDYVVLFEHGIRHVDYFCALVFDLDRTLVVRPIFVWCWTAGRRRQRRGGGLLTLGVCAVLFGLFECFANVLHRLVPLHAELANRGVPEHIERPHGEMDQHSHQDDSCRNASVGQLPHFATMQYLGGVHDQGYGGDRRRTLY